MLILHKCYLRFALAPPVGRSIDSTCCTEVVRGGLHDDIVQKGEAERDR
jgi:hypothetical protein